MPRTCQYLEQTHGRLSPCSATSHPHPCTVALLGDQRRRRQPPRCACCVCGHHWDLHVRCSSPSTFRKPRRCLRKSPPLGWSSTNWYVDVKSRNVAYSGNLTFGSVAMAPTRLETQGVGRSLCYHHCFFQRRKPMTEWDLQRHQVQPSPCITIKTNGP